MAGRPREQSPETAPTSDAKASDGDDAGRSTEPGLGPARDEGEDIEDAETVARDDDGEDSIEDAETQEAPSKDAETGSRGGDAAEGSEGKRPVVEPPDVVVDVFGQTHVGQIREHNEDNFLVADLTHRIRDRSDSRKEMRLGKGGLLFVVCDGMGGAAAGEVASQMAIDTVYERMLQASGHCDRDRLAVDVIEALEVAGGRILEQANNNRACRGMGTTATVAALVDDHLLLGQVGDSRAYILREGRLVQVTRDQSLVNQLIEAGQLTEEEAENFEHSNIILQALGTAEAVQVDLTYAKLRRGDVLLMCSDGLSGMIRDNDARDVLIHAEDVEAACRMLIDDANEAGGHDNVTVITARFRGEGLEAPADAVDADLRYAKYTLPSWLDDRAGATQRMSAFGEEDSYDDTPLIEITGEFEIDPDTDWEELLDPPEIPKEEGAIPNVVIWLAVAVLVFALYYFVAM